MGTNGFQCVLAPDLRSQSVLGGASEFGMLDIFQLTDIYFSEKDIPALTPPCYKAV